MDAILKLLRDFVSGQITAEDYANQYMNMWKKIRDEQESALKAQPALETALNELEHQFKSSSITRDEYQAKWQLLMNQVQGLEVGIGSKEDRILSHLFVDADAYEPDPEIRDDYQIGELELLEEVKKALIQLSE